MCSSLECPSCRSASSRSRRRRRAASRRNAPAAGQRRHEERIRHHQRRPRRWPAPTRITCGTTKFILSTDLGNAAMCKVCVGTTNLFDSMHVRFSGSRLAALGLLALELRHNLGGRDKHRRRCWGPSGDLEREHQNPNFRGGQAGRHLQRGRVPRRQVFRFLWFRSLPADLRTTPLISTLGSRC